MIGKVVYIKTNRVALAHIEDVFEGEESVSLDHLSSIGFERFITGVIVAGNEDKFLVKFESGEIEEVYERNLFYTEPGDVKG